MLVSCYTNTDSTALIKYILCMKYNKIKKINGTSLIKWNFLFNGKQAAILLPLCYVIHYVNLSKTVIISLKGNTQISDQLFVGKHAHFSFVDEILIVHE